MGCDPIYDAKTGRIIGIAYSRGTMKLKPTEKCGFCENPSTILCDVCDKPACKQHSYRVAIDTDVCENHNTLEGRANALIRRKEFD